MAFVYYAEELDGTPISELPGAYEKTVVPEPINTFATAGFKVPLNHPDADFLLSGDALIRVDETGVPGTTGPVTRFHGRIVTADEVAGGGSAGSVAVTAADAFWVLLRRLIGKSAGGWRMGQPAGGGLMVTSIVKELVQAANLEASSGLALGLLGSVGYTSAVEWYYQVIGEKIAELCATLDGPDYRVRALPTVTPGSRLPAPTGLTVTPSSGGGFYLSGSSASYAVTAFDANGVESPPSATVTATQPGPLAGTYAITWSPVPGAVDYKIYRRTLAPANAFGGGVDNPVPGWRYWSSYTFDGPNRWVDTGGFYLWAGDVPTIGAGYQGGFYNALDVYPSFVTGAGDAMGAFRLDAAFEFGDGLLNVESYQRGISLDGTANRVFHLPAGFPDNATSSVLMAEDTTSQAERGLLEAIVSADLTLDTFRNKLLAAHIAARKDPRQVITFKPVKGLGERGGPRYGVDYKAGDVVPFRASYLDRAGELVKRIDVLVRIYQVAFAVDQNGVAEPTLTVTPS